MIRFPGFKAKKLNLTESEFGSVRFEFSKIWVTQFGWFLWFKPNRTEPWTGLFYTIANVSSF
jgi:hypothetical protein